MSGPRNHTTKNIMDAIRKGYAHEVERYLSENPDSANNAIQGMTPLHLAASHIRKDEDIILMLIEAGADINAEDQAGNTPLHLAAINKNETAIKLFIQFGADVNAKNIKGETPAERVAKLQGYDEVIQLMEAEYSKATLEEVQGEVGPEYYYLSDKELGEPMQIPDEVAEYAIQYPSAAIIFNSEDNADVNLDEYLQELEKAENKNTHIPEWPAENENLTPYKSAPTTDEFLAKTKPTDTVKTSYADSYLETIREIVNMLPATSGTKRKYQKALNDKTLTTTGKVEKIIELAKDRGALVGKRSSTLFRNVDTSQAIHKAIAKIDTGTPYSNKTPLAKSIQSMEKMVQKRADALDQALNEMGFGSSSNKK